MSHSLSHFIFISRDYQNNNNSNTILVDSYKMVEDLHVWLLNLDTFHWYQARAYLMVISLNHWQQRSRDLIPSCLRSNRVSVFQDLNVNESISFYSNDTEVSNKVVANGEWIFFRDLIQNMSLSNKKKKTGNCYDTLMEI